MPTGPSPTVKPSKYDNLSGGGGSVGQNVHLSSSSTVAPPHAEGAFTTRENSEFDALERQMYRYKSRGPPQPPTGVPDRGQKTPTTPQTTRRQIPQRTEQQIQLPAQDPNVANRSLPRRQQTNKPTGGQTPQPHRQQTNQITGVQTPQPPQTQTSQPIMAQTPQPTGEGTSPHDQQRRADKRPKKARVPAVTSNEQTTAGSKR